MPMSSLEFSSGARTISFDDGSVDSEFKISLASEGFLVAPWTPAPIGTRTLVA